MYDYDGDMGYFQRQLERAGIGQEEVDMNNYAGLTARAVSYTHLTLPTNSLV